MKGSVKNYSMAVALAAGLAFAAALVTQGAAAAPPADIKRVDFRDEVVSRDVRHVAGWAVHSGDHKGLPFIVVDKKNARAAAFDRSGHLIRTTPVLLGMGIGDTWAPGVVNMDMYDTKPWQRITPAGRFVADEDLNSSGERVLWVDYDTGIALHKIPAKRTKQRRHQRMYSINPSEHRITYGCINVPPAFYDEVVHQHFKGKGGVVYILPEVKPLKTVFNSYDAAEPLRATSTSSAPQASRTLVRKF